MKEKSREDYFSSDREGTKWGMFDGGRILAQVEGG